MGWATLHIERLLQGTSVTFRPRGHSMRGRVEDGQLVRVRPVSTPPQVGDVVLCRVRGREFLHLIRAARGQRYLIGNNRGGINGWISARGIYGVMEE